MTPLKPEILHHLGLPRDPFGPLRSNADFYESPEYRRVATLLHYAALEDEVVAVVGRVGSGKTGAIRMAQAALAAEHRVDFVRLSSPDKARATVGHVVECLLAHLDAPSLPASQTKRAFALRTHLAQAHRAERRLCLLIDEAHRLPGSTLKGLKELHESTWYAGRAALFGIVYIGHDHLLQHYERVAPDVWQRLRAHGVARLGNLTAREVAAYVRRRCEAVNRPELFDEPAARALGGLADTPLEVNELAWRLLDRAYRANRTTITELDVLAVCDLDELRTRLGLSYEDVARRAGIGRSTVADVLKGRGGEQARAAVEAVLHQATREDDHAAE